MGLYSGGLISGKIFAPEIWGGGRIFEWAHFWGGAYNRNITVFYS